MYPQYLYFRLGGVEDITGALFSATPVEPIIILALLKLTVSSVKYKVLF